MKSLNTIQKTFRVFQILAKIAMILSFVACGLALLGLLCAVVWQTSGTVYDGNTQLILTLTETVSFSQIIGELLIDAVFALTDGILFLFAYFYFKAEQADGTPFTCRGADQIKRLGIRTIVLSIAAVIIASVLASCFGLNPSADWSNGSSVLLGILLILISLVFRYGAELEKNVHGTERGVQDS